MEDAGPGGFVTDGCVPHGSVSADRRNQQRCTATHKSQAEQQALRVSHPAKLRGDQFVQITLFTRDNGPLANPPEIEACLFVKGVLGAVEPPGGAGLGRRVRYGSGWLR